MSFSRTSLGHLDLNLLSVLVVVIEEQSTIAAAHRLHLAQSTVSGMLGRLREIFDDELLVRSGRNFEPTARALDLVQKLKPHIEALSTAVGASTVFDPNTDSREFRIGCTDAVAYALLPQLTPVLRRQAPKCDLIVRVGDYRSLPSMLTSGEITTAIGYLRDNLPATAKARVVLRSEWVVLRDANQPAISSIADFCDRPHVIVSPKGNLDGFVDEGLKALGKKRRLVLGVSNFSLLLATLPGSDLIATVPDFIAGYLAKFGQLAIDSCPVEIPPVTNRMVWSSVANNDPSQRWLRARLTDAFADGTC
ncbi:MAG: LysR family transcriptional regulator [Sphingomonadaceae bacterium]